MTLEAAAATPDPGLVPFSFEYACVDPSVSSVDLVGSWDQWSTRHPMRRVPNTSHWRIEKILKPGVVSFKFVCNSHWVTSPDYDLINDGMGGHNNAIEIVAPALSLNEAPPAILAVSDVTVDEQRAEKTSSAEPDATEAEAESESDAETETEPVPEQPPTADPDVPADAGAGAGAGAEAEAEAETETEPAPEQPPTADPDVPADAGAGAEAEAETEPVPEQPPTADPDVRADVDAGADAEAVAEAETEPALEQPPPTVDPDVRADANVGVDADPVAGVVAVVDGEVNDGTVLDAASDDASPSDELPPSSSVSSTTRPSFVTSRDGPSFPADPHSSKGEKVANETTNPESVEKPAKKPEEGKQGCTIC